MENTCNQSSQERRASFEIQAVEALRTAGFRITSPRVAVIRALGEFNRPLSANEIHSHIAGRGGHVDSVSVYRILTALQSVGVVHRIGVVDAFYACGLSSEHVHDTQHFVCEACGCVSELDIASDTVAKIDELAGSLGFKASEIRLEVLGLCAHCQKT